MLHTILDRLTHRAAGVMGIIGSIMILYCMTFGVTDVFLRYALNSASQWISPTIQAAMVLLACAGGAYSLKHGSFIKLDLFYANFSPRKKALCDILTSILTFAFLGVLIWKGIDAAIMSYKFKQTTPTAIPIPIYPIKAIIPLSAIIVLLIASQQLLEDLKTVFKSSREQ
ncbi:TRAP transporter small permease subunit [Halomonas sp. 18H]|uniref:TRAP transporter small permease subunit n=1 Tax=Halomonas almeriensis TaxID=308163 RepID=UPI00223100FB|nr:MULTISPECIES: TRAP transporter small permease subunit [Halomonas]MCW4149214.1 TRAP transporter small permease subunit [Halomonas sp. 18H]MDN3552236.1 TRAP transporter small permease subunit [Halomonas almeriensis]